MHVVRSSTTKAVRTPRRLRSLWRFRVGAVAGLSLAATVALLPSAPAFGAGVHHRRPDPPLQVAHIVSLASGGKPVLSKQPADYIPATISGKAVVIDPRSTAGSTVPSCQIPAGGVVVTPLVPGEAEISESTFGGVWDCPEQAPVGTGFVAGFDASKVVASTPKLSTKALYADRSTPADPGSVKVQKVKVDGQSVKVFVFRSTNKADTPAGPAGTVFEIASAEPTSDFLVTATTPSGTKPVPYLTAMLKAGAGKMPQAG
jgi:hypothetical protein